MATCGGCGNSRIAANGGPMRATTQANEGDGVKTVEVSYTGGGSGARTFMGRETGTRYRFDAGDFQTRKVDERDLEGLMSLGFFEKGKPKASKSNKDQTEEPPKNPEEGEITDPTPAALKGEHPAGTTTTNLTTTPARVEASAATDTSTKQANDSAPLKDEASNRGPEPPNQQGKNLTDGGQVTNATGNPPVQGEPRKDQPKANKEGDQK